MEDTGNCYISGSFLQRSRVFYTQKKGLPSNDVTRVVFDKTGRLWAGTAKGLAYFDGEKFIPAVTGNKSTPLAVNSLFCDNSGCLWVVCGSKLFTCINNKMVLNKDFGPGCDVADMAQHGDKFYLLVKGMLYRYEDDWQPFKNVKGDVRKLAIYKDLLYVSTDNVFYGLEGKRPRWKDMFPHLINMPKSIINAIRFDTRGHLWVGTDEGVYVYDNTDYWIGPAEIDNLPAERIYDIAFGANGTVLFGSDNGVILLDKGALKYLGANRWLPHTDARSVAVSDDGSEIWAAAPRGISRITAVRMTLGEKAAYYQHLTETYNLRDCFAGDLEDIRDGDISTGSIHIPDNDGLWTGYYAAAQIYRYAVTGNKDALKLARRFIDGLLWLTRVTDLPGFAARAIRRPGEKGFGDGDKEWFLSSDGSCEWKCETSSDEMVGHFLAFSLYYDLCAEREEKREIAAAVCGTVDHILRNNYRLVDKDGLPTTWAVWAPEKLNHDNKWVWEKGVNSLEILAFLKAAHHMSGNAVYDDAYRELIRRHHYALNVARYKMEDGHLWHNDDTLSLLSMITLLNLEDDNALRAIYLMGLEHHWQYEKVERTPLWNFIYGVYTGRYCDVDAAVQTLREIPLDLIDHEIRNSTRKKLVYDTEQEPWGEPPQLKVPLPADERSAGRPDNNHFRADGGNGTTSENASFWLLPYWFARYYGLIKETEG